MQSFLTVFLAAIVAFFAFAMMPPESETDGDLIAEAEPPILVAETTQTPVFVLEAVEPLVLALDAPTSFDELIEFDLDRVQLEAN